MQTRWQSVKEVLFGTAVGFIGSWLIMYVIMHYSPAPLPVNVTLVTIGCTVWSLLRGYAVRRWFTMHEQRSGAVPPAAGPHGVD